MKLRVCLFVCPCLCPPTNNSEQIRQILEILCEDESFKGHLTFILHNFLL
jgi:hypothetical protein